jgi:simple sugar transport system permease protein
MEGMNLQVLTGVLTITIQAGAVMLIAAIGELLDETSGVINLGIEGLMTVGAVGAIVAVTIVPNPYVALLVGALVGILFGLLLAVSIVTFNANQVVSGFALAFFATGLGNHIGRAYAGLHQIVHLKTIPIPGLSTIPILGPGLFTQDIMVYVAYLVLPVIATLLLFRTRLGITIRACGHNPAAADAAGISVRNVRYFCVIAASAAAGLSGAYLVLAFAPTWSEGLVSGRGFIAVCLVMFSQWRPSRLVLGTILFGLATSLGFVAQIQGWSRYSNLFAMVPYVLTVALLILPRLLAKRSRRSKSPMPAALGQPFIK